MALSKSSSHSRPSLTLAQKFQAGLSLHQQGRLDAAGHLYREILQTDRQHADALHNLGILYVQQRRLDRAVELLTRAVKQNPHSAMFLVSLGNAFKLLNRDGDAIGCYQQALLLDPNLETAHCNLGSALQASNRPLEAGAAFEKALALNPDNAMAHYMLGNLLQATNQPSASISHYTQALALMPNLAEAASNLGDALQALNRTEEAIASYRKALAVRPDLATTHTNLIFTLNFLPNIGMEEQQKERRLWDEQHARRVAPAASQRHGNDPDPDRRLRIGYCSAYFRHQAATYAFAPMLLGHDPSQFEVFCYSDTRPGDDLTERLRTAIPGWREVAGLSHDALADRIRADGIDILVDLVGHMSGHRLLVFARKPAPVQVSGWGEPTGTGLAAMDYLFADPVLLPQAWRGLLSEEVADLPCFLTYWTPERLPPPGPLPALANGYVTFGSFNRITKLTDAVLRCWSGILRAVPGARLVMKHHAPQEPDGRARIQSILDEQGIAPERVGFLPYTDRAAHFAAFAAVDIALDPFPHGGGMTTLDALAMGVPVITWPGKTISSRLAAASLSAVGFEQMIASDLVDYANIAASQAADLAALARLRDGLPSRMKATAVGDNVAYVRAVEAAYRGMWRRWCTTRGAA